MMKPLITVILCVGYMYIYECECDEHVWLVSIEPIPAPDGSEIACGKHLLHCRTTPSPTSCNNLPSNHSPDMYLQHCFVFTCYTKVPGTDECVFCF